MNKLNPPRQTGKFAVSSDSVLAVLGMIALFQIALCFSASFGLVRPADPIYSTIQGATLETNAPWARESGTAAMEKLSSFPFTITPR